MCQFSSIWRWWGTLIKSSEATSIGSDRPRLTEYVWQCTWMRRKVCLYVWPEAHPALTWRLLAFLTVVDCVHELDAVLHGWREGYFTSDPLWKIVRAARSRIKWCLIIHWEIMNVLNHTVCRSLLKLFKNKLKHRFNILKKCAQKYLTCSISFFLIYVHSLIQFNYIY